MSGKESKVSEMCPVPPEGAYNHDGIKWKMSPIDDSNVLALTEQFGIGDLVVRDNDVLNQGVGVVVEIAENIIIEQGGGFYTVTDDGRRHVGTVNVFWTGEGNRKLNNPKWISPARIVKLKDEVENER